MNRFYSAVFVLALLLLSAGKSMADDARLQIIHNAADPGAAVVDVYVNGNLLLDDFQFRAATPFVDVPGDVNLNVGVAPGNSASVNDTLKNFPIKLKSNKTYVAVANGVLDPNNFAANPDALPIDFTIFAQKNIREAGRNQYKTDFVVLHGATDAPEIDVLVVNPMAQKNLATEKIISDFEDEETLEKNWHRRRLVNNLAYSEFSNYRRLVPQPYILEITPAQNNSTPVASFNADLTGLGGGAAVVFASGFLDPAANQNGAGFGLFAALPNGLVVEFPMVTPPTPEARLQIIHNAADPGAAVVDVYVNGNLFVDDFAFRAATPFVTVPAGVNLDVGIAPGSSTSASDTLKNFPVMFADGGTYVAIANGVLDPTQFAANPDGRDISFTIFAKDMIREAGTSSANVDFIVEHGSTDAPTVDVIARNVGTLVDNAAYGDITNYLSVPAQSYILDITPGNDNSFIVASFNADLTGLGGGAAVVFASGFLDPAANQNGAGFGLFAALPNGLVVEFPMAAPPVPEARLQIIHNAADPGAAVVDVYVNGNLFVDDFAFRAATPFVTVPAGVNLDVGIAPGSSTTASDTLKNFPVIFADGGTYVAIANGVLDATQFAANPDGRDISFTIFAKDMIREAGSSSANVDFIVEHGSTDAPTVDVIARNVGTLVDDAAYGDITNYLSVPAQSYILDITPGNDNSFIVASFNADLTGLGGGAAVVFASGFLNPATNQNGAGFGLFAALPNGLVVEFPMYTPPTPEARLQIIHNAADPGAAVVDVYVNGSLFVDDFAFRAATPFVTVPAGVNLDVGIAPGSSTSASDTLKNFPVMFADGGTYVAIANGVLDATQFAANPDGRDISFTIFAKDSVREQANNTNKVDLFAAHGASDAPTVNIIGFGIVLTNVGYGDISDYVTIPATRNWLVVYAPRPSFSLVGVYRADVRGLEGQSAVVFASGFIDPAANQNGESFKIFAALANGAVVELPKIFGDQAQEIIALVSESEEDLELTASLNSALVVKQFELQQNYPNPFNPSTRIAFNLPQKEYVTLKVFDIAGREIATLLNEVKESGNYTVNFDASALPSGVYFYRIEAGSFSQIRKMMLVK